jgi:hypothetical protein
MPYGYDLVQTENGYQLVPASFTAQQELPYFSATRQDSQWKVDGAADGEVREQIEKLLRYQAPLAGTTLQAAP